jgi:hypothetical protein
MALALIAKIPPPSLPSWMQDGITKMAASAAPNILDFEKREITFRRHPLQRLHHLVQRAEQGEQISDLPERLKKVPETLRHDIFFEVWTQATDLDKKNGDLLWGEHHVLSDYPRLLNAIKAVVERAFDSQPQDSKNAIYGTIYRMAGQLQTFDLKWGETNAKNDTIRLIRSMHRHHCLGIRGKEISVYSGLEKGIATPSCSFHLYRKELDRGQIGVHNGMANTLNDARTNAIRISDHSGQGYNIHCTYSATVGQRLDMTSAILGQGGTVTPPVLQLIEEWHDLIEQDDETKRLQICSSRGAIEVYNALALSPKSIQRRIIVIAIAPGCLIPSELAYQVVNLVIPSDAVVKHAANRHLMTSPHTKVLSNHADGSNAHDLHGLSYREELGPMIDRYIRTNEI